MLLFAAAKVEEPLVSSLLPVVVIAAVGSFTSAALTRAGKSNMEFIGSRRLFARLRAGVFPASTVFSKPLFSLGILVDGAIAGGYGLPVVGKKTMQHWLGYPVCFLKRGCPERDVLRPSQRSRKRSLLYGLCLSRWNTNIVDHSPPSNLSLATRVLI